MITVFYALTAFIYVWVSRISGRWAGDLFPVGCAVAAFEIYAYRLRVARRRAGGS